MIKTRLTALLAVVLILFTACGEDIASQIIRYDIVGGFPTLDPQFATNTNARMVISNTFEGLYRQTASGEVVPCLAQSSEVSADGLTHTFHLREDSKWSSGMIGDDKWAGGSPVTAHDFAFALSRMFDPTAFSPFAAEFSSVKNASEILGGAAPRASLGVRALDDYTLQIELVRPDHRLPELLASSFSMPCNQAFFEATRARYGFERLSLLYNGPLYVSGWDNAQVVTLRRNPYYLSEEPPRVGGVNLYIQTPPEGSAVFDPAPRFLSGNTDICKIDDSLLSTVLGMGGRTTTFEDTVWVLVLKAGDSPLANPDLRKAVAHSVDSSLFEGALPENLRTARMLIPPAVPFLGGSFRERAGENSPIIPSVDLARRYLAKGLAELELSEIPLNELLIANEPAQRKLAGYVQQGFQNSLSTFATLVPLSEEELLSRVESGDFQAAILPLTAAYSSPDALLSLFQSGSGQNFCGYSSPEFDALLESISSLDGEAQFEAYRNAEELLITEAGVIPLYFDTTYYASARGISGIEFSPFLSGIYFKNARKTS